MTFFIFKKDTSVNKHSSAHELTRRRSLPLLWTILVWPLKLNTIAMARNRRKKKNASSIQRFGKDSRPSGSKKKLVVASCQTILRPTKFHFYIENWQLHLSADSLTEVVMNLIFRSDFWAIFISVGLVTKSTNCQPISYLILWKSTSFFQLIKLERNRVNDLYYLWSCFFISILYVRIY